MRLRRPLTALIAAVCLAAASPAAAQNASSYQAVRGMDETFRIDVGGFFQTFDTTLQFYRSDGTPGTEFNLEDMIGTPGSQTTVRVDGMFRFGRHGNLQFSYRGWSRNGETVLSRDIEIGDDVYHAGAQASSKISQYVPALYYGYSFVNNGRLELGAMIGVAAYFSKFSLSASGSVGGGSGGGSQVVQASDESFVAPLPAIGGYLEFTLLPKFFLVARVRGLPKITVSSYSGSTIDAIAGLDIYFTNNIGIGGGYEYVRLNYSHEVPDGVKLKLRYSGPLAYLTLAF